MKHILFQAYGFEMTRFICCMRLIGGQFLALQVGVNRYYQIHILFALLVLGITFNPFFSNGLNLILVHRDLA